MNNDRRTQESAGRCSFGLSRVDPRPRARGLSTRGESCKSAVLLFFQQQQPQRNKKEEYGGRRCHRGTSAAGRTGTRRIFRKPGVIVHKGRDPVARSVDIVVVRRSGKRFQISRSAGMPPPVAGGRDKSGIAVKSVFGVVDEAVSVGNQR